MNAYYDSDEFTDDEEKDIKIICEHLRPYKDQNGCDDIYKMNQCKKYYFNDNMGNAKTPCSFDDYKSGNCYFLKLI